MAPRSRMKLAVSLACALLVLCAVPTGWSAGAKSGAKKRILYFTKSSGFEHSVVRRKNGQLAWSERILVELGKKHGYEIVPTKDGRIFTPDNIKKFDAFIFYATGDLTKPGNDKQPPMSPEGKKALLKAIADGKGFVGIHAGNDAFHGPGKPDPFIQMLGGEFMTHGRQQKAHIRVVSPDFPGMKALKGGFTLHEEWYIPKNLAPDLHVILLQDTKSMNDPKYNNLPPYPETWARMEGKGRVFYTSLGHREDVWTNPTFQHVLMSGIAWVVGDVDFDVTPNIQKICPDALKELGVKK